MAGEAERGAVPDEDTLFEEPCRECGCRFRQGDQQEVHRRGEGREAEARQTLDALVRDVRSPDAYFAAIRTYEILGDPRAAAGLRAEQRRIYPGAKERKEAGG